MIPTKYNFNISSRDLSININRLTNQIWKLIPMKENNENWLEQLETVIIEITGLNEIFNKNEQFLILLSKLEGLRIVTVDFIVYRKTVFEAISLLRGLRL